MRILQHYTQGFDPRAKVTAAPITPANAARGYALRGPSEYGLYLVATGDHRMPTSGVVARVNPARAGAAVWIDPATGHIVGRLKVRAGVQDLIVPRFVTDIALKIGPSLP